MSAEGTISIIVGSIAACGGLLSACLVYRYERQRRRRQMEEQSAELDSLDGGHGDRKVFQFYLGRVLAQFCGISTGSKEAEVQLEQLYIAADIPFGLPPMTWPPKSLNNLCPDQRMLYDFACFHSQYQDGPYLGPHSQQAYYRILQFWERWARNMSVQEFRRLDQKHRREFILLAWLELASLRKQSALRGPTVTNVEVLGLAGKLSYKYKRPPKPCNSAGSLFRHAMYNVRKLW